MEALLWSMSRSGWRWGRSGGLYSGITPADLSLMAKRNNGRFPADHFVSVLRFGSGGPVHGTSDMPFWRPLFRSLDSPPHENKVQLRIRNLSKVCRILTTKVALADTDIFKTPSGNPPAGWRPGENANTWRRSLLKRRLRFYRGPTKGRKCGDRTREPSETCFLLPRNLFRSQLSRLPKPRHRVISGRIRIVGVIACGC